MEQIAGITDWLEYERAQWHRAVRQRGLELRSLDPEERRLVFDAITLDLERRKRDYRGACVGHDAQVVSSE